MTILLGNTVNITCRFRDAITQQKIDPTAVTCTVTAPSGAEVTYTLGTSSEMRKIETGVYVCAVLPNAVGDWGWLFSCSGTASGVSRGEFTIDAQ
jgi:hypothetical protein